jgi:hypothetical protein
MARTAVSSLVVEQLVGVLEDDYDCETKPCDRERGEQSSFRTFTPGVPLMPALAA